MRKTNIFWALGLLSLFVKNFFCFPVFAERMRLSDIPDPTEKKARDKKNKSEEAEANPLAARTPPPKNKKPVPTPSPTPVEINRRTYVPKPEPKKPPIKRLKKPPVEEPQLTPEEATNKSNERYMQALSASQNGRFEEAYKLCKEALEFDPSNLQANRMCDRLESRKNPL